MLHDNLPSLLYCSTSILASSLVLNLQQVVTFGSTSTATELIQPQMQLASYLRWL